MSVIAEFRVPSSDFELGRILTVEGNSTIELETLVPLGGDTVPLFWVHNTTKDSFVEGIKHHPSVHTATEIDMFDDRTLFTLKWDSSQDHLIKGIRGNEGQILSATGTPDVWKFEVRFPTHEVLSTFSTHCENALVTLNVTRVYNPTDADVGSRYGLTGPQYEAMVLATRMGYYDIPRVCTTKELADELGISDQAVTERLRRAIVALVTHTLDVSQSDV